MRRDFNLKYDNVVSLHDGMAMLMVLGGFPVSQIFPPMMVWRNQAGNYPIRGVLDNVHSIC